MRWGDDLVFLSLLISLEDQIPPPPPLETIKILPICLGFIPTCPPSETLSGVQRGLPWDSLSICSSHPNQRRLFQGVRGLVQEDQLEMRVS